MKRHLPLAIIQLEAPPENVSQRVGEQQHWFIRALNLQPDDYCVIRPDLGEPLPHPAEVSAAILSGSWAMVTDHAEWSERTAAWVRGAVDHALPLLGVCYGHQLMAYALGGEVGDNPRGWERGLQTVITAAGADDLPVALPPTFSAWLSHRQSVLTPPAGAEVLASSALDPCQIIRYSAQALSFQFHPEFSADIMRACLLNSSEAIDAEPLAPAQAEAEWPLALLRHFWLQAQHAGAAARTVAV